VNILLLSLSGHIKISDFGFALENAVPGVLYSKVCGTPWPLDRTSGISICYNTVIA